MSYEIGKATGGVVDSSATATDFVEGLVVSREGVTDSVSNLGKLNPVILCTASIKPYGTAQADPDINEELAVLHTGIVKGWDDTPGTLANDDPVKPSAAGELALWVGGADTADVLYAYVERIVDATTGELEIRLV